ncbi:hypothetical protein QZH41_013633, partial [Actinostola sp. cb2023]
MEKLTSAHPHFIRCIKPNHLKVNQGREQLVSLGFLWFSYTVEPPVATTLVSGNFDGAYVEDQLKYTGVLETTRIRREGYAVRLTFNDFVDSYKLIVYDPFLKPSESSSRRILKKSKLNDWHIGKTKVFMKYWHTEQLAKKLEDVQRSVIKMQKVVRGFLTRRRYKRLIKSSKDHGLEAKACLLLINLSRNTDINKGIEALKEKKRIELLREKSNTKYASLAFEQEAASAGTQIFSSIDDVRFVDEGVGDFDVGEDEFVREPDATKAKFGAVATKETAVQWYQETQAPKGAGMETKGVFHEWFHGVISRRRSEMLLTDKPVGCFLVRVSESRFGYSLSYRTITPCRRFPIHTKTTLFFHVEPDGPYECNFAVVLILQSTPVNKGTPRGGGDGKRGGGDGKRGGGDGKRGGGDGKRGGGDGKRGGEMEREEGEMEREEGEMEREEGEMEREEGEMEREEGEIGKERRVPNRCKHYMIDQTRSGKYVIVGLPKVFKSLDDLVSHHQKVSRQQPLTLTTINDDGDLLGIACGQ